MMKAKELLLITLFCTYIQFNLVAQSTLPTMDKLFKLRWHNEILDSDFSTPCIREGLVFFQRDYGSAYDIQSGDKKTFGEIHVKDSLALFYPIYKCYLMNLNSGEERIVYPNSGDFPTNKGVRFLSEKKIIYRSSDRLLIQMDTITKYAHYPVWKFKSEISIFDKYYRDDSILFVFTENKLYKLNYYTGIELDVMDFGEKLASTPIFNENKFYFITSITGMTRKVWSIDINTWSVNWTSTFEHFSYLLDVVVYNENLYVVDNYGLNTVDKKTGELKLIISGYFEPTGISIVRNFLFIQQHIDSEDVPVYAAMDLESNKIKYRTFTSEGFPPVMEETMSDEAKRMKADGISGWNEGLGYHRLDVSAIYFKEDPQSGLVIANGGGYYCLEFIEQ